MELQLVGFGIHPQVDLSLGTGEELCLDMGNATVKDVVSKTFSLLNSSPLKVRYHVQMEMQLPKKRQAKTFSKSQGVEGKDWGLNLTILLVWMSCRSLQLQWTASLCVRTNGRDCGRRGQ